ncbi:hypothetical protein BH23ACT11_BH23ACT11_22450 [soil metagenome]
MAHAADKHTRGLCQNTYGQKCGAYKNVVSADDRYRMKTARRLMAARPTTLRGRFRATAAIAMMLVLFMLAVGCGLGLGPDRPNSVVHADSPPGYTFESLPRLVATSEVVVEGTVETADKGRRVVPDDELFHRAAKVRVENQFYGPPVKSTIIVHQDGYEGDTSFEFRQLPWVYPGDRVVFFLAHPPTPRVPPDHYEIVAAPGMLVIEDDGTVSTEAEDPIARRLDGQQWPEVEARIRAAGQAVQEQDIKPLHPGPFGESQ